MFKKMERITKIRSADCLVIYLLTLFAVLAIQDFEFGTLPWHLVITDLCTKLGLFGTKIQDSNRKRVNFLIYLLDA